LRGKGRRQPARAFQGAVGDHHPRGAFVQQRPQHAAHGAARAQHQDPSAGDAKAQVVAQIAQQAGAVGVVGIAATVRSEPQRVRGPRPPRLRAGALRQPVGLALEGHGHAQPLAAGAPELAHGLFEAAGAYLNRPVADCLVRLPGKQGVNVGGLAVPDRMPHHRIVVADGGRGAVSRRGHGASRLRLFHVLVFSRPPRRQ